MKTRMVLICPLVLLAAARAQEWRSYQTRLETVAKASVPAVLPIMAFGSRPGVRGSAFLINRQGYFLTAAHVLKNQVPDDLLSVIMRAKGERDGGGQRFEVIESDEKLDVALCKISHFEEAIKGGIAKTWDWGTLAISNRSLPTGHLVAIAGFPLGSWNASFQAGHIAAEYTILPQGGMFNLFQVSVAGNQGDSGGPVIDLETGKVVGLIVIGSFNAGQDEHGNTVKSSGLLYALPISKISDMLARHSISVEPQRATRQGKK